MNGGEIVANVTKSRGVTHLFTLCGGHISPILVWCKKVGIKVVDVRHEASAVFAADAYARMSGIPGLAAVTAGPGLTNTLTALKNAQMAKTPLVLIGGATATLLKGRGALQDIDQISVVRPHVKAALSLRSVGDLAQGLNRAFQIASEKEAGPVFVELPIDLLYDESLVRSWYQKETGANAKSLVQKVQSTYIKYHLSRVFPSRPRIMEALPVKKQVQTASRQFLQVASMLKDAKQPLLLVGPQALTHHEPINKVSEAVKSLAIPTYLAGSARGLLGKDAPFQFVHHRKEALKESDLILIIGLPFDFRLNYGRSIPSKTKVVMVGTDKKALTKNRRPYTFVNADGGEFLVRLSHLLRERGGRGGEGTVAPPKQTTWMHTLRGREESRQKEIATVVDVPNNGVHPLVLSQEIEQAMNDDAVIIVDGGDFVATAAYVLRPRRPLGWLDPGVFGTLGVGGGFLMGAHASFPNAEKWLLFGDGAFGYSLPEIDTWVRHKIGVIAVIGNDASWSQIARDQVKYLKDDVGTVLHRSDYHKAAESLGGKGYLVTDKRELRTTLQSAKKNAALGIPVVVNVHLSASTFREGSLSV